MPLSHPPPLESDPRLKVRRIDINEAEVWIDVSARGWSESPEASAFLRSLGTTLVSREDGVCFIAEWDGEPIATGSMSSHGGVLLLSGASTLPHARGRGAQRALLGARLRYGHQLGCDLATMGASPGSTSQHNAERQGFRVACTRLKWRLD
jgi:GNAT superfamily N-acetyltransferase